MARIEDYALIGDLHTAALIDRTGSIDWLCFPRFDSPACFAALLDTPDAGHWRLGPSGGATSSRRRYRGSSLVLETEWDTPDGTVRVTDFMPPRGHHPDVIRIVEGLEGEVRMSSELALRFDYGSIVPWVRRRGDELEAVAGPDSVWFWSTVDIQGRDLTSVSDFVVREGERVPFVLTWGKSHEAMPHRPDPFHALQDTLEFWDEWNRTDTVEGRWEEAVTRSLVVLKAMTYAPTGGIVAAVTTSLPEELGGTRNWDYRYCWLRDATYTLQAMLLSGHVEEAAAWRDWLLRTVAGDPGDLQIMYGLDGARRLPEMELPWLKGYEGSSPVRIGNDAAGQLQLDVWGEVLDSLFLARQAGLEREDDSWNLQKALMHHLEARWQEPDNGLWEMRGDRRHFTHSKVMAWVAADRMVRSVEEFGLNGPVQRWRRVRDEIRADVLAHGVSPTTGTFTQSYGSDNLDASLLLIPRVGFLPFDDPRVVATVEAIQRDLTQDGLVMRYRTEESADGLPGSEGVFLACSFWLVDALHGIGRTGEARALFDRLLSLRNDVGLLAEEYDPVTGRQLGNFPQAFSHFPLVVAAHHLTSGEGERSDDVEARAEEG
ncbi:glycoside hydrolase family 15 protein [Kineococcus radiotolerans]|uniref:Trehalase n=1 Tax=Kineococcus radiotolerans (strain ATCC BAA-149 / DSM 14245 / SRS30216) TaxID=266940 RepID=A6W448_KINRD|nr:glycoside hydrolase family 15 protein [Kineococcus radiotolerans]ABS01587.1 glycoside hydrolase 15-related [Kineococcus radiotolerans SRS30216 = ATCC BAA-149]